MTQLRSQVKVMEFTRQLCGLSIASEAFERFLLNYTQLFLAVSRTHDSYTLTHGQGYLRCYGILQRGI